MIEPQVLKLPEAGVYMIADRSFYLEKDDEVVVVGGEVFKKIKPKAFPENADKGNVHFDYERWVDDDNKN